MNRIHRLLFVLAATVLVLASCGSDDDDAGIDAGGDPTTTASPADDDPADDPSDSTDTDDSGGTGSDVNAQTQAALDEARALWAAQDGTNYVWEYTEDGEGLRTAFCYEGVAGGAATDEGRCPLAGTEAGESVDSFLDNIQQMLDFAAETPGREVYAEFDPTTGHPTQVEAFGGEVDGLLVLTDRFEG